MLDRAAHWLRVVASLSIVTVLGGCGPAEPERRALRAELGGDSPLVAMFRDAERQSNAGSSQKTSVLDAESEGSCACRQARPDANGWWWLALALALPFVRRRRQQEIRS
jgi:MYXO-CTERM domain-containing protein